MTYIDIQSVGTHSVTDRHNAETIWNEFGARLRQYVRSHVADPVDVDDILQDVFLKIHANVETLRDESKLLSWVYQITRHAITDHYRRQQPLIEIPETLASVEEEEDDLSQQLACGLREIVDALPTKYREALILSEYEDLSQQEVATRLGISVSGAKSRIQRARGLLKGQLLQCCHFELDRLGKVIDYTPHCSDCANSPCAC